MNLVKFFVPAAALLVAAAAVPASPALAQADPEMQGPPAPPKIVRNCRKTGTDEIIVCGRERSPYRLPVPPPGFDPDGGTDSVSRERNALLDEGGGGIGSCSTSGPGGASGCMAGRWKRQHEQSDGHGRKKGLIAKVRGRDDPDPLPDE